MEKNINTQITEWHTQNKCVESETIISLTFFCTTLDTVEDAVCCYYLESY